MSRIPSVAVERPDKPDRLLSRVPLKDTSKNFVNSTSTTSGVNSAVKGSLVTANAELVQRKQKITFIKPLDPIVNDDNQHQTNNELHVQQLTSGDRVPDLIDCSTPKKDGQVPYLTSNTIHNALTKNALNNTAITTQSIGNKESSNNDQQNLNQQQQSQKYIVHKQVIAKKMTGDELTKWQQTWKDIMPKNHILFESMDSTDHEQRKAMLALRKLGATIERSYNDNVTIIVSRRQYDKNITYPINDIFRNANKKQLKIWSIDKVFRFLNHLGESILKTEEYEAENVSINNPTVQSHTLSNMLLNERLFGPSDRDPNVKRNEIKYFTGSFLYIWDYSHKTRPVAIREWKDKSYPRINPTTNGKSLFSIESKSQNTINILKRHLRRYTYLKETFEFRQEIINAAYKVNLERKDNILLPNYDERIKFKRKWEESVYGNDITGLPEYKFRLLYETLNEVEKAPFKEMFEDLSIEQLSQIFESDEETSYRVDNVKRQKLEQNGQLEQIENKGLNELDLINIEDLDEDDIDEESLKNLISDKSDDIDKMNPINNSPLRMNEKINKTQIDNKSNFKYQSISLNKVPKLMRQDSNMISNSQNTCIDGKMRDYGEITASGIQASGINPSGAGNGSIGNGLGPSKSSVVNKLLANESKRIIVLSPIIRKSNNNNANTIITNTNRNNSNNKEVIKIEDSSIIPDEIIQEIENEKIQKERLSANDDELAALRSAEGGVKNVECGVTKNNPFISEKNEEEKAKNRDNIGKVETKVVENLKNDVCNVNVNANVGIFKKEKQEKGKQEMKPGYCENCRVKYSDFSDHVESDKHRTFAENDVNFKQIDGLIELLHERGGSSMYVNYK